MADTTWKVVSIDFAMRIVRTEEFARQDIARRRADELAHSLARRDAASAWAGRPTSGIAAIICDTDVWLIPEMAQGRHGATVVHESVPAAHRWHEALAIVHSRRGYTPDGIRC